MRPDCPDTCCERVQLDPNRPSAPEGATRSALAKSAVADAGSRGRGESIRRGSEDAPMLLPTTLVGSYAQPEWLIDRGKLAGRFPPRVRAKELWRIPEPYLAEAQDDATVVAIKAAGGRRPRHRHRRRNPARELLQPLRDRARGRRHRQSRLRRSTARAIPIPFPALSAGSAGIIPSRSRISNSCAATRARMVKMTVPGPFTMSQQAQNDFYPYACRSRA